MRLRIVSWCLNTSNLSENNHELCLTVPEAPALTVKWISVWESSLFFASPTRFSDITVRFRSIGPSVGTVAYYSTDYF